MATKKASSYINYELDFLVQKAEELKEYVAANPFHNITDRINYRPTKTGVMPMVIASIETQVTSLTRALKDYAEIISVIDKLREKEDQKKIQTRGDKNLTPLEEGII